MQIKEIQVLSEEVKQNILAESFELNAKVLLFDEETGLNGFVGGTFSLNGNGKKFSKDSYGSEIEGEMKEWVEKNKIFQRKIEVSEEVIINEILNHELSQDIFEELKKNHAFSA